MNTWLILGAGGHGRSVADAICACGDAVLGFLDDNAPPAELVAGAPVLGPLALTLQWPHLPHLNTAPDRLVLAGAVVNANAMLYSGVLLNSGAVVDHDAICGAYSQLGINAAMAGGSRLGPLAVLAAGEVLGCGESRFAELELAPGAADLSEGVSCHGSAA